MRRNNRIQHNEARPLTFSTILGYTSYGSTFGIVSLCFVGAVAAPSVAANGMEHLWLEHGLCHCLFASSCLLPANSSNDDSEIQMV